MKAYEKAMATVMVTVMVMSVMVCILPATEDSDAATTSSGINLSVGQTKVTTISVNDTAFDFEDTGDGIKVEYSTGSKFSSIATYSAHDGWTGTKTIKTTYYDVILTTGTGYELNSLYELEFTGGEKATSSAQTLTISITITSHGEPQYVDYTFAVNVYETVESIAYSNAVEAMKGKQFNSDVPTVKMVGDSDFNSSNFAIYVTGQNPGVAIMDDLSIKGSVPSDGSGWTGGKMMLKFFITDTRTGYSVSISSELSYTLKDAPSISYEISYNGGEKKWNQNGILTGTIVSGGSLTITGSKYCVADIITTGESGTTSETVELSSTAQDIDVNGTGVIEITIRVPGYSEQTVTITVIDDMIPVNSIYVTCGPVAEDAP